jgi:hypothetical protein
MTTTIGPVLHFLNMRITIGPTGISLDQTEAIIEFCRSYWGTPLRKEKSRSGKKAGPERQIFRAKNDV